MTRILNRWPHHARAVAARVALTFSLAAASVHAAPTAQANGGWGESARIDRGRQVLSELNAGRQQPVLEAMRRNFPFLAEATAGYALNAGASADELKEIVYLLTVPAGFPRAIDASQALQEVFVERSTAKQGGQP